MNPPLRVLLIDDNPDDRTLARFTLERAFDRLEVTEIIALADLEHVLAHGGFDVVITDYQLHWSDGLEVLRRFKSRDCYTPVIMFTATGTQELAVEAMKVGLDDYVIKAAPHFVRLPASIRAVLERAHTRRRADEAHAELQRLLERERALHEQAEVANRAKDDFLATLSHELRTPLTSILGWAKMLRERPQDAGMAAKALTAIVRNAEAQTKLIDDLLDVSQIITGRMRLDLQSVQLDTLLESALDSIHPGADKKGLTLTTEGNWGAHAITADASRVRQILWNLLSNAVKFTPNGGRITVTVEWLASVVRIRVEDTGIGFTKDFESKIFTRFSQADSSTTRRHGGLGLGLAIVRHLVELHGGRVEASSPGSHRGATFTVELPLGPARRPRIDPHLAAGVPDLHGVRVVLVDDDEDTRDLVEAILRNCGATVTVFDAPEPALAAVTQAWPDVVVSDIAMPDMDGYTFGRRVRSIQEAAGVKVSLLALTGDATVRGRREALAAGFDRHVAKPIDPAEFQWLVATLVGRAA